MVTVPPLKKGRLTPAQKCPKMSKKFSHVFINQKFENESIMLQSHFLDTFSKPGTANPFLDIFKMSNLFFYSSDSKINVRNTIERHTPLSNTGQMGAGRLLTSNIF